MAKGLARLEHVDDLVGVDEVDRAGEDDEEPRRGLAVLDQRRLAAAQRQQLRGLGGRAPLVGGIFYSHIGNTEIYYFLGWVTALLYIPLYLYRTRIEDKREGVAPTEPPLVQSLHEIHEK